MAEFTNTCAIPASLKKALKGRAKTRGKANTHSEDEYVRGDVHINGVESFWALIKRGIYGVFHHISPRHLHRYANEVAFRLDQGNCEVDTIDRIKAMIRVAPGRRLTYDVLIQKVA